MADQPTALAYKGVSLFVDPAYPYDYQDPETGEIRTIHGHEVGRAIYCSQEWFDKAMAALAPDEVTP